MKPWYAEQDAGSRAAGSARRAGPHRRARASVATLLLLFHVSGCYHYVPVSSTSLPVGANVSVGISDQGRIALTEPVGPGVRRLSGMVVASTDTTVVLAVNGVDYIDLDTTVRWDGERVTLSRSFINDIRERQLSKRRTWLMAGLVVVGAVLVSTLAITGFGSDGGDREPDPGPGQQQ